jgi:hypothetical protein
LWQLRDFLDLLVGGVGLRRDRRDPGTLQAGDAAKSTVRQTAIFDLLELFGLLYWDALYPVHQWILAGMLSGVANVCRTGEQSTGDFGVASKCTQEP